MDEQTIERFWDSHPCGDAQVGGLDAGFGGDYAEFFRSYDAFRYRHEAHIPRVIASLGLQDQRLLEVGLGEGADSQLLIGAGARWSGLDLTAESVQRVATRMAAMGLPHDQLVQGSVTAMPFAAGTFDVVFSHGVLHHVPDILAAQREIARVLTPDGRLIVMLYARWSLNYVVSIGAVRRAAVLAGTVATRAGWHPSGQLGGHLANARAVGLGRYLRMSQFVHANTDGPANPYSKVYDHRRLVTDFPDFAVVRTWREFMHAPPLPVHRLPGAHLMGWHLWAELRPRHGSGPQKAGATSGSVA